MKFKIKTALATFAAIGLISGGFSSPAFAAGGAIDLVDTNDTLSGSTISGYAAGATLRLAIISNMGTVTWNNNGSGANQVNNSGNTSQGVWLEGTQDQLNAALAEISVNKPCAGSYKIYAQVSDSGYLQDPVTHHLYKQAANQLDFDPAVADAAATPLVSGGTDTFGYMANATTAVENIIVSNFFGQGWIAASDSATEGDWKWVTGPEAGTSFYSGRGDQNGAAVNGKFASWASNEPNDWGNSEDYAEILGNGQWNDINNGNTRSYTIEWGGMPGDNLTSVEVASDSIDISVNGAFTGGGTSADPYLIPDATALHAVPSCGSGDAYFKQTANITLPNDWSGDQNFEGHYDGNGKSITFSANTPVHNDFGVWAYGGQNNRAYVHDLTVTGDLNADGAYRVGLVFGTSSNVDFNNITVDGSFIVGGGRWGVGGVSGVHYNGTLDHITSTVDFHFVGGNYAVGGIAGEMDATVDHSTWNGAITGDAGVELLEVGGLVGTMDCGEIFNSSSAGTIEGSNGSDVGGLAGYTCGDITDSHSSVSVNVTAANRVGGLIGEGDCTYLGRTWATGNVTGNELVGGLAGSNCGEVGDSYARGNVSAQVNGGSLMGGAWGSMYRVYSTGAVTDASGNSRGWVGTYSNNGWSYVHWNPTQSTIAEPGSLENGEVPFNDVDAKDFNFYDNESWNISQDYADDTTWIICANVNDGYPILTHGYSEDPCSDPQTLSPTPTITGTGVEGSVLTGKPGTWDSGVTLTYAWLVDGAVIANETSTTYTPVSADVGKSVTFRVTSTKVGFRKLIKTSAGKTITPKPVIVVPTVKKTKDATIGGFAGNSWWAPLGFTAAIKSGVKAHSKATVVTCVGIVAPGGSKAWQKTLGLKRAELACSTATSFNSKLKTKLSWKVAAPTDKILRGVTLKFNK